jgi:hypothetical protein
MGTKNKLPPTPPKGGKFGNILLDIQIKRLPERVAFLLNNADTPWRVPLSIIIYRRVMPLTLPQYVIHCHFPTLLTIVDNFCLHWVYNKEPYFIVF